MERLVVLLVLTVLAIAVSLVLQRRRPEAPTAPSYRAPVQIDRGDFDSADISTLVVMFTSATCDGCVTAWDIVRAGASEGLANETVAVQKIEIEQTPDLHQRYKIDGVPTTLIVDDQVVVSKSYFGPLDRADIVDQLAESGRRIND